MSYNIYLDDWREPIHTILSVKPTELKQVISCNEWDIVRSYNEFIDKIMKKGLPDIISFDHDLGPDTYFVKNQKLIADLSEIKIDYDRYLDHELTGYHCAQWLANYCMDNFKPLPRYVIHSDNEVGSENIRSYLENFKKHNQWESSNESGIQMGK